MFRTLAPALLSGLVAAIVMTIVQAIWVAPLILQAEVFEQAAEIHTSDSGDNALPHSHQHEDSAEHHHTDEWAPENGWERHLYSVAANLVMGVGFALLLVGAYHLKPPRNAITGLAWAAAGYASFFVAPSMGLPPELPGTAAAELMHRQEWWLAAVASTVLSLSLLVWAKPSWLKLFGLTLLALPHVFGAPKPEVQSALAPDALQQQFVYASFFTNAAFWLALGLASSYLFTRINSTEASSAVREQTA